MLKILSKIFKIGVITDDVITDDALAKIGADVKRIVDKRFRGSLSIREVDSGSCNGCELEINALNNPYYDIERYGIHFVASPRHADLLLVTGPVSRHMEEALRRTYAATPEPKWVIAVGDCGADGGEFGISYASAGAVSNIIPVDLAINGCPPSPTDLMTGIIALISNQAH